MRGAGRHGSGRFGHPWRRSRSCPAAPEPGRRRWRRCSRLPARAGLHFVADVFYDFIGEVISPILPESHAQNTTVRSRLRVPPPPLPAGEPRVSSGSTSQRSRGKARVRDPARRAFGLRNLAGDGRCAATAPPPDPPRVRVDRGQPVVLCAPELLGGALVVRCRRVRGSLLDIGRSEGGNVRARRDGGRRRCPLADAAAPEDGHRLPKIARPDRGYRRRHLGLRELERGAPLHKPCIHGAPGADLRPRSRLLHVRAPALRSPVLVTALGLRREPGRGGRGILQPARGWRHPAATAA